MRFARTGLRAFAALALIVSTYRTIAQTPLGTAFTYQGRLENAGSPASGLYDLRFRLYDAAVGGVPVGATLCTDNLNVTDGLFTVPLDFGAQFAGQERFLEIDVRTDSGRDCTNAAGFVILSPRQALTATPNALNADRLDGLESTAFLQSVPNPLTLNGSSVTHIIRGANTGTGSGLSGQSNGLGGIGVFGYSTTPSGVAYGGRFESDSTSGIGVMGKANIGSGANTGVWGESPSATGRGVCGLATAASGQTYGGFFQSQSAGGRGVYGLASANSDLGHGGHFESASTAGTGVYGWATHPNGSNYGVIGRSDGESGLGVYGFAAHATGDTYGGYFESFSTDGIGVAGVTLATSGMTHGVHGFSRSPDGTGVYGDAASFLGSGVNYGVYGISNSTSGRGVYGTCSENDPGATPYGVRGVCSTATQGYAVFAVGDMGASGVKPFRIDHPFDPENKYLLHYSAESPEVINFYSGKVTLDERGEAVVELPAYFAGINKDPRYTLTAVGAPMPMLHVAEEISDEALRAGEEAGPGVAPPMCSFRIAGGVPGAKVSWEVKALRNDLRMRLHGAPVEREKTGPECGRYQHPEYYGQPAQMGMDYDAAPDRHDHQRPSPTAAPD
jgi:hypothetical protein